MSVKEVSRLKVMEAVESKRMRQHEAACVLCLTTRQVRRLQVLYREQGAAGLVSRRRGKSSNNRLDEALKEEVVSLVAHRYVGFGPTLAHEKLAEEHDLHLCVESLRQLMIDKELWKARCARKPVVHQMRERRAARGELVQIDGSPHAWFEERGPRCTLIVFIDDATGDVQYLRFVEAEDTWSYFEAVESYIHQHGKPLAFYSDRHSVFKVNAKEVQSSEAITQFGRAMQELDIQLICAQSPQAKGRVERMNQTLQDRLVKELRLQGINSMEEANAMLPTFIESLNAKFAVAPRNPRDAHRQLEHREKLDTILTLQAPRVLSKNLTLQFNNIVYQIKTARPTYAMRRAHVLVSQDREGTVTISYKGKLLQYEIHHRQTSQAKVVDAKEINVTLDKTRKALSVYRSPSLKPDHPWRKSMMNPKRKTQSQVTR
ncbi:MAG: ISNCY family transposase [Abditibacteriaceae bacterium]